MAEAAPLKQEIARLRAEQSKLPLVEAQLAQQAEARGQAQRVIANTEAHIDAIHADSALEIKLLKKKLEDVHAHLAVCTLFGVFSSCFWIYLLLFFSSAACTSPTNSLFQEEEKKLQDREDELKKIQDDYDNKIKELQLALTAEMEVCFRGVPPSWKSDRINEC